MKQCWLNGLKILTGNILPGGFILSLSIRWINQACRAGEKSWRKVEPSRWEESLKTGLCEGFIKKTELNRVNVDSTVQGKAVRYPTDARFYDRMRERLVKSARPNGCEG